MLTHQNILANTEMCAAWMFDVKEGAEKVLGIVPFFHVYGLTAVMNYSIKLGFEMILLPKFDPLETLKIIDKHRPTLFPGHRQFTLVFCITPNCSIMICHPLKAVLADQPRSLWR